LKIPANSEALPPNQVAMLLKYAVYKSPMVSWCCKIYITTLICQYSCD